MAPQSAEAIVGIAGSTLLKRVFRGYFRLQCSSRSRQGHRGGRGVARQKDIGCAELR